MYVIHADSPDHALAQGFDLLKKGNIRESARGRVIVMDRPVTTVFNEPWRKVLHSPIRDANPFFHLMEALWMLRGEHESRFLDTYVKDFGARFAELDEHAPYMHGAYGYRWRKSFGFDQLHAIATKLKNDPTDRQAVLQMWDCNSPAFDGLDDLNGAWRDRPCNTHVYFRADRGVLDMTVCCRSNDMIWGAYGANLVHFGFLMEYIAAGAGLKTGRYYQVSNNFHAYMSEIERLYKKTPEWTGEDYLMVPALCALSVAFYSKAHHHPYEKYQIFVSVSDFYRMDKDIDDIYELITVINGITDEVSIRSLPESFNVNSDFCRTLIAAAMAHKAYRAKQRDLALECAGRMIWPDWRDACVAWLTRRKL